MLGQVTGQPEPPPALPEVAPPVVGEPGRSVACAVLGRHVVGGSQHPHPQLLDTVDRGAERQQRSLLLPDRHEQRIDLCDIAQRAVHDARRGQHRVQVGGDGSGHGHT